MKPELLQYIRALTKNDKKSLTQKTLKTVEEVGELAKVVLPYENAYATTHRFVERERILEEAVDATLCTLSVAYELDFTDQEIEDMMIRKAEKWASLQAKEDQVTYPLPFEIHVTVNLAASPIRARLPDTNPTEQFRATCKELGVKPIILDLQGKEGVSVMTDVMTSSKHFGDNRSAYLAADDLFGKLWSAGYEVVRNKIETVPWHPAAPQNVGDLMPPNCYFESHIPITLHPDVEFQLREDTKHIPNLHVSRNTFKTLEDGRIVVMLTYRAYDDTASTFKGNVDMIVEKLNGLTYQIGKVHTEFAVYDTKMSHDAAWLKG